MTAKNQNETATGPMAEGRRWSAARKRAVILQMLREESVDTLSRVPDIEIYRLEEWWRKFCPQSMSR